MFGYRVPSPTPAAVVCSCYGHSLVIWILHLGPATCTWGSTSLVATREGGVHHSQNPNRIGLLVGISAVDLLESFNQGSFLRWGIDAPKQNGPKRLGPHLKRMVRKPSRSQPCDPTKPFTWFMGLRGSNLSLSLGPCDRQQYLQTPKEVSSFCRDVV